MGGKKVYETPLKMLQCQTEHTNDSDARETAVQSKFITILKKKVSFWCSVHWLEG